MRKYYTLLLGALIALALPSASAWSDVSTYFFAASTGTAYGMNGATTIFIGSDACNKINVDDNTITARNIGFNFVFDGITYTKFSLSTNGVIGLHRSTSNSAVTSAWTNSLTSPTGGDFAPYSYTLDSIAQITPFWDDLRVPDEGCNFGDGFDGVIRSVVTGSAPNRVFVIEFNQIEYVYLNGIYATWQVRLFETSNKIEFWYEGFSTYNGDGASIGIAAIRGASYLSVTPGNGGSASVSSTVPNDRVNPTSPAIPANTLYTFAPCGIRIAGNTAQGGTTLMTSGDSLLVGKQSQVGGSQAFQPFSISLENTPCTNRTYTYSITGPAAADYSITPTGGTISANSTSTPTLTYRPRCGGKSTATLTITGSDGSTRAYPLAARATAQNQWTGNIAQGGTPTLTSGDTLLANKVVIRRTSATFQPISIMNTNTNGGATPSQLTYTINDPTGQYSVSPASVTLNANQTSTPTITFAPMGVGNQSATLTVSDGCDIRTFVLYAFSAAPGGIFILNGQQLDPTIGTFINYSSCVGEFANTQAVIVTNVGVGDFNINSIEFYQTDTVYGQGIPRYPLRRDANGNAIRSYDYFLTTQPGVAPSSANPMLTLPITVAQGQSRTIYITYVGQYPGKRFARAFINTNGQNFLGTDLAGNQVEGMLNFDVFARATGSLLSDNPAGGLPKAITFPATRAGDSADVTFSLTNPGFCDLRISRSALRINSGDVNEFQLLSALSFQGTPIDNVPQVRNDYVLSPGQSATITVRFKPSRGGSRRATLLLRTNDSTVQIPGITERGAYYLDLFGTGKAGLDFANVALPPAVIDAAANAGGVSHGMVELTNSSKEVITIANLAITGTGAAEISEDAANKWPVLPTVVLPGQTLKLALVLQPAAASPPGLRTAQLDVTLGNGETLAIAIEGYAGTRLLALMPPTLFDNAEVLVGTLARRTVAISNAGTMAVTIQQPTITGIDAADFQIGTLERLVLEPGQVEYLEVTYAPTKLGPSQAVLEVTGDATNGKQTVALSATGAVTERDGSDADAQRVAGVETQSEAAGMVLKQSVPNPGRDVVAIGYRLAARAEVALVLYDAAGHEVTVIEQGVREAGEHTVKLDASDLATGSYRYRLTVNGISLTRSLTIVK